MSEAGKRLLTLNPLTYMVSRPKRKSILARHLLHIDDTGGLSI
jgi:hypothetical protein